MITHDELKTLVDYSAQDGVAISFYLDADVSHKEMRDIETKDLIKNARKELSGLNIDRSYLQAAEENLDQIRKFISSNNSTAKYKSIAIFANSADKFYKIYWLPIHMKSRLVIDTNFYVRPLLAVLEEHCRLGIVLIDSKRARLFEIYIGEILEHLDFSTAARNPRTPLLETFMKREKKMAQKKEGETRLHLSLVADLLKTHFLMRHFDKLIIGGKKPLGDHLARLLHPKLHENLIAISEIDIHAKEGEILSKALSIEREFELSEENKLLRKMMNEIERGGYAVKGMKRVIEAAQDYSLQTVAIADDFSQAGLVCSGCGMPHLAEGTTSGKRMCVSCGGQLVEAADVVNHIVDEAGRQNAAIKHIRGTDFIGSLENIAAVIKFKKDEFVKVEEAVETES
jgi:peptide chain release factor subunit 1